MTPTTPKSLPAPGLILLLLLLAALLGAAPRPALAEPETAEMRTPPRLSLVEGSASFWRPGAADWAPARPNTPLAPGDALYTGDRANLEIQVGPRAYLRLAQGSTLSLLDQTPDFFQFKLPAGQGAFDLRLLPAGHSVELDTPNAVFSIASPGYYRAEVVGDTTHFIVRRGGHATVTLPDGQQHSLAASEEAVVQGSDHPEIETYVAPELDAWDRWNYARSEHLAEALSHRYIPPEVYGADDLDHYGDWRQVESYGSVWVPQDLAPGWSPYSTGSWMWDPFYGWTWVDLAPWGWAPYHYGRWVFINSYWAWAPGPRLLRPLYAPALVAFFRFGGGTSLQISLGGPGVGWVALGWGEPLLPWWGPAGFHGQPWWGGWGGPRVVNNVVIERNTVVNIDHISFRNAGVPRAMVAVRDEEFGRGRFEPRRVSEAQRRESAPVRGEHPVRPVPSSLVAQEGRAAAPPRAVFERPTVAAHAPRQPVLPWREEGGQREAQSRPRPAFSSPRVIESPAAPSGAEPSRPPFGTRAGGERPQPARPPSPPAAVLPPAMVAPAVRDEAPAARGRRVPPAAEPSRPPFDTRGGGERPQPARPPSPPAAVSPPAMVAPAVAPAVRDEAPAASVRRVPPAAEPARSVESPPRREERPRNLPPPEPRAARPREEVMREAPRAVPRTREVEAPPREVRSLPGQPANRLYPREEGGGRQAGEERGRRPGGEERGSRPEERGKAPKRGD